MSQASWVLASHCLSFFCELGSFSVDSVCTTGGGGEGSETGQMDEEGTLQMHNKKCIDVHCLVIF